ncbi:uncharacterized protein LOC110457150 [Mizuhopecten yessoensis]|uniref:phospholipase A2 n=1 Tax=Mizuhopecten yessoensis TaxID=6573 RepID=A0A210Q9F1_MIZYE|nr:uncharacterized protein LOC110457150 [Mizuhopecten yessoensis]OWF45364.1 Acidic phospholipase A2 PA4 [Mizuhopecten yessoensis]
MPSHNGVTVLFFFAVLCGGCSREISDEELARDTKSLGRNFILVSYNDEMEKELRIAYRGVLVLETVAFENTPNKMHFKRVSDGKQIIQSVYQDGVLKDCDFGDSAQMVLEFVNEFTLKKHLFQRNNQGDVFRFYNTVENEKTQYAIKGFKSRQKLGEFKDMVKIYTEIRKCHKYVRHLKRIQRRRNRNNPDDIDFRKAYFDTTDDAALDGTLSTARGGNSPEVTYLDSNVVSEKRQKFANKSSSGSVSKFNSRRTARSATSSTYFSRDDAEALPENHERRKRSFFNKYLIFPGTKWCGRGQIAKKYDELGDDQEADVCCRDHDCCQDIIPCFSTKHNYFNYRFHAILHCDCDRRFRGCLKQSVSPMASLIGRIYFNIMGSKCFTVSMEEVCVRRSWWGRCEEYGQQEAVKIEDQEPYNYCEGRK